MKEVFKPFKPSAEKEKFRVTIIGHENCSRVAIEIIDKGTRFFDVIGAIEYTRFKLMSEQYSSNLSKKQELNPNNKKRSSKSLMIKNETIHAWLERNQNISTELRELLETYEDSYYRELLGFKGEAKIKEITNKEAFLAIKGAGIKMWEQFRLAIKNGLQK